MQLPQLRLVLFTHPYCGLCIPVKQMITALQSAPQFNSKPFLYHEVNIQAPGNEIWNTRYGLKIPVLYLYRHTQLDDSLKPTRLQSPQKFNDLEREFWDDPRWLKAGNGYSGWVREVMCVMDFEKKESKFQNSGDMAQWIWKQ